MNARHRNTLLMALLILAAFLFTVPAYAQDNVTVSADEITTPWMLVALIAVCLVVVLVAVVVILLRIAVAANIAGAARYQQGLNDGLKMLHIDKVPELITSFEKHASATVNPYDDFLAAAARWGLQIIVPKPEVTAATAQSAQTKPQPSIDFNPSVRHAPADGVDR